MNLSERIETILPLVGKPARYLGNEFHAVRKDPSSVRAQWLLILPEVYEIGMSHWGLKILYDVLNRAPESLAERAYCPWLDMEAQMRRRQIPLFSLESHRPAAEFDLVGFSLQYELTCTNILTCLDLAGIPLQSDDRRDADPLVIGGGPCVSNPEPLAAFFDLFLLGDGEEAVGEISRIAADTKNLTRIQRLKSLAQVPGVYVPGLYEPRYDEQGKLVGTFPTCPEAPARPARTFLTDLEDAPFPITPIVPLQEVVQDRLNVEVLRGCTQGCRFCQAGYLYRPLRERSAQRIMELTEKGLRSTGWDRVSLVSLSTAEYTQLDPLTEAINRRFANEKVSISLPSLRADRFGIEIADRVREVKRTGFTFAPEAGTDRLRLAINKPITDEDFFTAAGIAYERGWRLIKLYMMIGLPTETEEDIEGIITFTNRIRAIGRLHGSAAKVNVSVGAFVPKSHTPFQWDPFENLASLNEKLEILRMKIPSRWSRLKWNELEISHIEAVLSRGDRRLSPAILRAWELGGRFDGWTEHFSHERWTRALEESGLSAEMYTRRSAISEPLPWDHIDVGILKKFLIHEREKTDRLEVTKDCRHGDCAACGIPGMPNDTRLAPKLDADAARAMLASASAGAARRSAGGILWPVRIRFAKRGRARFLSHLETGKIIDRAFRMAGIPVGHTAGHSPHPKYHFGPPLPVGVTSEVELFDVDLETPWRRDHVESLNSVLPRGFAVLHGRSLPAAGGRKRRSLAAEACLAWYEANLGRLDVGHLDEVRSHLEVFSGAGDWILFKRPRVAHDEEGSRAAALDRLSRPPDDPRIRTVDLKKACIELVWDAGRSSLRMLLRILDPNSQTANPAHVLGGILGLSAEEQAHCMVTRTAILRADRSPITEAATGRIPG
jgi:radical SAM family uncharacterized protein/radical SAM-linked protein